MDRRGSTEVSNHPHFRSVGSRDLTWPIVLGVLFACSGACSEAGPTSSPHDGTESTGGAGDLPGSGGSNSGGAGNLPGGSGGSNSGGTGDPSNASGGAPDDGNGSGGALGFSPCPAQDPCKILPLGDSITEGMDGAVMTGVPQFNGGYRVELFSLALQAGKNVTFVGSKSNGPDIVDSQPFPKNNEGYSGYTIQQIIDLPNKLSSEPHIVLLHIGTNDMIGASADTAPERLQILIDQITTSLPNSLLVVSNIIPLPFASANVTAYNAALPPLAEARAEEGAHILFVDQFTGFPLDELPDSVHPSDAGYARMGRVWFDAIEPYLRP